MFEELNKILDAIDKHLPALPTPTDFDFKEFERGLVKQSKIKT